MRAREAAYRKVGFGGFLWICVLEHVLTTDRDVWLSGLTVRQRGGMASASVTIGTTS